MKVHTLLLLATTAALPCNTIAAGTPASDHIPVSDQVVAQQRHNLAASTNGKGFGPQSPRSIDSFTGNNRVLFNAAPAYTEMNLCNIHFHRNAEHAGGEFTRYAGNGDGHGNRSGYRYSGRLGAAESAPLVQAVCPGKHGGLQSGDTIEVHYVHSTAPVRPGPTLGACLGDSISNPQLRVETQVYVLVNDDDAGDFRALTRHAQRNGRYQAVNIPDDTGVAVQYAGSTTGPGYNETGSPFQVTWNVRPKVARVSIASVGEWCKDNVFDEDHAHGTRNLVTNPDLLSAIER